MNFLYFSLGLVTAISNVSASEDIDSQYPSLDYEDFGFFTDIETAPVPDGHYKDAEEDADEPRQVAFNEVRPDGKAYHQLIKMAYSMLMYEPNFLNQVTPKNARAAFNKMMSSYGCNCFPSSPNDTKGNKAVVATNYAVDELDAACLKLQQCRKCIDMDYLDNGVPVCDPDYSKYRYKAGKSTRKAYCRPLSPRQQNNRQKQCHFDTCQCDLDFVNTVYELFKDGEWKWDEQFWLNERYQKEMDKQNRSDELFDRDTVCFRCYGGIGCGNGGKPRNWQCCGNYPDKRPYDANIRSCCDKSSVVSIYNPSNLEECCEDGSIGTMGQPCV